MMDQTNFLVWIDSDRARIIELIAGATRAIRLETYPPEGSHTAEWKVDEIARMYLFDEIADTVEDGDEIVLSGPGGERFDLRTYLQAHRPSIAARVISVEQIGNASDTMLRTFARTFFRLTDRH